MDLSSLFAQELPAPPTTVTAALITLSVSLLGVVVWVVRHVFVTTIPGILASQQEERKANQAIMEEVCTTFKSEAAEERKSRDQNFTLVNSSLVALASSSAADGKQQVAEINRHVSEEIAKYRHEQRDIIHQAVLQRDLYLLQQQKRDKEQAEVK